MRRALLTGFSSAASYNDQSVSFMSTCRDIQGVRLARLAVFAELVACLSEMADILL